ncbi:hypothetical protein B0J11DRAFT_239258 [Dendryphion nanum]|uniref:Uncharacterized protein n=1 Tax=Dendryphion nanum TaxID=256645 RepID=A0A9P9I616_9PLEO|nr:hypothetical protein B0J11DRAFT_239258 [Dendryphion nanum]
MDRTWNPWLIGRAMSATTAPVMSIRSPFVTLMAHFSRSLSSLFTTPAQAQWHTTAQVHQGLIRKQHFTASPPTRRRADTENPLHYAVSGRPALRCTKLQSLHRLAEPLHHVHLHASSDGRVKRPPPAVAIAAATRAICPLTTLHPSHPFHCLCQGCLATA